MFNILWSAWMLLADAAINRLFDGDWIIPELPCCTPPEDPEGACIFQSCCDFRFMLRHVWRTIRSSGNLQPAHGGCKGRSVECCSVNYNSHRGLPWYNHGLLNIRVQSSKEFFDLKVLQPTALNYWSHTFTSSKPQFSRSFPTFDLPLKSGAGILWSSGYALGQVIGLLSDQQLPGATSGPFLTLYKKKDATITTTGGANERFSLQEPGFDILNPQFYGPVQKLYVVSCPVLSCHVMYVYIMF